jgi:hypothetical protein
LRAIIKVSLNGEIKREWPLTYALWPCPCFQMWFWWSFLVILNWLVGHIVCEPGRSYCSTCWLDLTWIGFYIERINFLKHYSRTELTCDSAPIWL